MKIVETQEQNVVVELGKVKPGSVVFVYGEYHVIPDFGSESLHFTNRLNDLIKDHCLGSEDGPLIMRLEDGLIRFSSSKAKAIVMPDATFSPRGK